MLRSLCRRYPLPAFLMTGTALHLAWEVMQSPFYDCFYRGFWTCMRLCLQAAVTGDLFCMLVIYLALALIHHDLRWPAREEAYRHPATWVIAPLIGMLLSIIIELRALYADHRWQYVAMPMLPVVRVGLLPVLQMIGVPLLTIIVMRRLAGPHR